MKVSLWRVSMTRLYSLSMEATSPSSAFPDTQRTCELWNEVEQTGVKETLRGVEDEGVDVDAVDVAVDVAVGPAIGAARTGKPGGALFMPGCMPGMNCGDMAATLLFLVIGCLTSIDWIRD